MLDATIEGRVLVTGAGGFIGSHLVDALLARGHAVIGLDRRSPARNSDVERNLVDALSRPRFTFVHADLSTDGWQHLVRDCRVVFHLAAVPGVRDSWHHQFADYVSSNVLGTQRLLSACVDAGVRRLVYASSSSVYGRSSRPSKESDLLAPESPYGVSKLAGEHLCTAYTAKLEVAMSAVMLRFFTVYGPRQRPDMAVGRLLTAALTSTTFERFGDGTQMRDFTYVSDVVSAAIAAAQVPATGSVAVNVGGGRSVSLKEACIIAGRITGQPVRVASGPPRAGDVPATAADLTVARRMLGYVPRVALAAGMAQHVQWLTEHTGQPASDPAMTQSGRP